MTYLIYVAEPPVGVGIALQGLITQVYIGVRGSPERDISSLRELGLGVRQILGIVRVSARAFLGGFR